MSDELIEKAEGFIGKAVGEGVRHVFGRATLADDKAATRKAADRIIALVRADERRRIREQLEAQYDAVKDANTDLMGGYSIETAGVLEGLSAAIGLTEEGSDHA